MKPLSALHGSIWYALKVPSLDPLDNLVCMLASQCIWIQSFRVSGGSRWRKKRKKKKNHGKITSNMYCIFSSGSEGRGEPQGWWEMCCKLTSKCRWVKLRDDERHLDAAAWDPANDWTRVFYVISSYFELFLTKCNHGGCNHDVCLFAMTCRKRTFHFKMERNTEMNRGSTKNTKR